MLRKVNDPSWKVPYIIGEGKKKQIKHYKRYQYVKSTKIFNIPRIMKDKLFTLQRPFGTITSELNEEDYVKFLELRNMKR